METQSLSGLFGDHDLPNIDVLHIDTEGFGYQVLAQFDLAKYKSAVVLYEHRHLHLRRDKQDAAATLLRSHGYTLSIYGKGTLALLNCERHL